MEYIGNLVIIGIYLMLEIKFDEEIKATLNKTVEETKTATKLMHSFWQNTGRLVLFMAILWNQPNTDSFIALKTFFMYAMFYWWVFDSIFASGVLNQKPWYLGETDKIDLFFSKKLHFTVWIFKFLLLVTSIILVIKH